MECKPAQELIRQARTRPNRYQLDEHGKWRCPPGEAYAAKYGLFYEVYASDQINWAAQDNWLFLEDYYQNLDRLQVAEADLNLLSQIVREQPIEGVHQREVIILHFTDGSILGIDTGSNAANITDNHENLQPEDFHVDFRLQWVPPPQ